MIILRVYNFSYGHPFLSIFYQLTSEKNQVHTGNLAHNRKTLLLIKFYLNKKHRGQLRKLPSTIQVPYLKYIYPGKYIRWDPANPTWDPRCVPGGIPPFSGGIPGGIMEHPAWDPTWDYGTSRMGSHLGLWNILHGIPPGIMEHPAWDPT